MTLTNQLKKGKVWKGCFSLKYSSPRIKKKNESSFFNSGTRLLPRAKVSVNVSAQDLKMGGNRKLQSQMATLLWSAFVVFFVPFC